MPMKLPLKDRSTTFLRCIPAVLLLCNAFLGYYLLFNFFFFFCSSPVVVVVLDFTGQAKTDGYADISKS